LSSAYGVRCCPEVVPGDGSRPDKATSARRPRNRDIACRRNISERRTPWRVMYLGRTFSAFRRLCRTEPSIRAVDRGLGGRYERYRRKFNGNPEIRRRDISGRSYPRNSGRVFNLTLPSSSDRFFQLTRTYTDKTTRRRRTVFPNSVPPITGQ